MYSVIRRPREMRKPGRPAGTDYPISVAVRITSRQAEILDNIRRQETDLPNRSEMMRRLIERQNRETATAD